MKHFKYKPHKAGNDLLIGFLAFTTAGCYFFPDINPLMALIPASSAFALQFLWSLQNKHRRGFEFVLTDRFLKVIYGNEVNQNETDFLWADVLKIEDKQEHILIKLNRNDVVFPIFKDMENYQDFFETIEDRANAYNIPIIEKKGDGSQ